MHITQDHPSQTAQLDYRGGNLCAKHQTMQQTGSSSSDFIIQDCALWGQDKHNRNHNVFERRVYARICLSKTIMLEIKQHKQFTYADMAHVLEK